MTRLRLKTVRGRTTAVAVAAVAVVLIIAALGLVLLQRQVLEDAVDDGLRQRVADLSALIEQSDDFTNLVSATVGDDTIVQIVDSSGHVVASTTNLDEDDSIVDRDADADIEVFDVDQIELSEDHDESFRVASVQARTPAGERVTVYAGSPTENVRDSVDALTKGLAIALPLLLLSLAVVLWFVTGRALRPVEAIRAQSERIGARDLDQRVPTTGSGDEVDRLAQTMNQMLGRLQLASEQQRSFVADASHELKTPLTGIITQIEAAGSVGTIDAYASSSETALVEAHRMRRLIEDLLALARGDASRPDRGKQLIDLDDIVLDEARRGRGTGATVQTGHVSAGQVRGNADDLRRVVQNLLDNARRHAKDVVTVDLTETGDTVRLTVADDGPGIAPADRERVFDRFVRLDAARDRRAGGAGLGLAIVKTLVEAHGGTIAIEDGRLGGAKVVVDLPAVTR